MPELMKRAIRYSQTDGRAQIIEKLHFFFNLDVLMKFRYMEGMIASGTVNEGGWGV